MYSAHALFSPCFQWAFCRAGALQQRQSVAPNEDHASLPGFRPLGTPFERVRMHERSVLLVAQFQAIHEYLKMVRSSLMGRVTI